MAIIPVTLAWFEVEMASEVGKRRHAEALKGNRAPRFPERYPGELWTKHIEGACAELAVAKLFGWYWPGHVNTFHDPDFIVDGIRYDVRWSSNGKAKVRPDDDNVVVIGVGGQAPEMRVVGGLAANYVKRRDEWYCKDPPPCWFVPFAHLLPVDPLLQHANRGN